MRVQGSKQLLMVVAALSLAAMACGGGAAATATPTAPPQPTSTPRPTATPEPAVTLGAEYRSEEGGFAFRQVPGYEISDLGGYVLAAPPDMDENVGPALLLVGGLNDAPLSPEEAYAQMTAEMAAGTELTNRRSIRVDGQPGFVVDVFGDSDGHARAGRLAVAMFGERQVFMLVGYAPPSVWEPEVSDLFDAVLASVTLFEAVSQASSGQISQWASRAVASSQFGDVGWSASRATGAPNVVGCADDGDAWASQARDTVEWLEVYFDTAVVPVEINIHQSYNPDQVVRVELITPLGEYIEVYTGEPRAEAQCPYVLHIPLFVDAIADGVRITVDQSVLGLSWNEIDAVELVGLVGGEATGPAQEGDVIVEASHRYVDNFGYTHIVGTLVNNSDEIITSLELTLELEDSAGETLLTDSNGAPVASRTFTPHLYTLIPGQATPFDFWVRTERTAATHRVRVSNYSATRFYTAASLSAENVELYVDDDGEIYLSGEIVNLSASHVQINALAGALLNDRSQVVASDWTTSLTRHLAPTGDAGGLDRTPFMVTIDGPAPTGTGWGLYWDASETTAPTISGLNVRLSTGYFDSFDNMRLVGTVTNNGTERVSVSLVAGLYAADGTVLDASSFSVPIYVGPGETVPFQAEFFSSVNWNAAQAARVDSYTIQVDHYWTFRTTSNVVALETENDAAERQANNRWRFTGTVVNDSGSALSSATVIVAIYDANDRLVGVQSTGVYPSSGTIPAGGSAGYELTVALDPDAANQNYTFITLVQGFVQ